MLFPRPARFKLLQRHHMRIDFTPQPLPDPGQESRQFSKPDGAKNHQVNIARCLFFLDRHGPEYESKLNCAILERIPAGRWGRPEDIAGTAVYLCSDAAAYVHGAVLNVDGGWMAR